MTSNGNVNPSHDTTSGIAVRKGIRPCTQHHIAILCPYKDFYQNTMLYLPIWPQMKLPKQPKTLNSKPRKDAMNKELKALEQNKM